MNSVLVKEPEISNLDSIYVYMHMCILFPLVKEITSEFAYFLYHAIEPDRKTLKLSHFANYEWFISM